MARPRVLVVEDEAKLRRVLASALRADYDVVTARDGEEALAVARTNMPDAILLDLRLPRLDGMHVLRCLKMSPETVEIPVVILSVNASSQSLLDAQHLGAIEYLIKPFQIQDVRESIRRSLFRHPAYPQEPRE